MAFQMRMPIPLEERADDKKNITSPTGLFAHHIGIRVGNYKLQKNALACFADLFTSAGKSNYSSSVTQYFGMLAQYPKLEEKLKCVSSVKIDNDEKRKGHYFTFDEALETFGIKFIKQNITGNVVDDNKLKLQVKAAQSERDCIGILLSEYLNDPLDKEL
ncbi:10683_t:CDS:2 [Rhizophagus irregularis]|nr:10683_t:CDS:2 [Rhizophagus irregularis]